MTDFEQVVVPYDDTFAWVKSCFKQPEWMRKMRS